MSGMLGRRLMRFCAIVFAAGVSALTVTGCSARTTSSRAEFPASSFSNVSCTASGATADRVYRLSGADSSGTADDTQAIQAAINAAAVAGGGIVYLPAGRYLVDGHLVLKSNVKLEGAGSGTIIKAGPGFFTTTGPDGGFPLITTAGARNVTISDLTADQSGNTLNANAYQPARLSAYLIDVRDSVNVVVVGVHTVNPFTYSIAVVGSSDFCVSRCRTQVATSGLYDELDGIHVLDSHDGQVIGNNVDQRIGTDGDDGLVAHTVNAPLYDVLYADNTVRGGDGGDGMQLAVGRFPIFDVTVRDNDFWGSPYGIRTGHWGTGAAGALWDISITGNDIHELVPGKAFPHGGNAINIGGFGVGPISDVDVTGNSICSAGTIIMARGKNNLVSDNHYC